MKAPERLYVEVCEDGIFAFPKPPFAESVEYIRADLVEQPLQQEQPEDIVVIAKTFLDALSKTSYNNKPITDAQIIVRQLLSFFESPKEYNPDAILEKPVEGLEEEYVRFAKTDHHQYQDLIGKGGIDLARHFAEWGAEHLKR